MGWAAWASLAIKGEPASVPTARLYKPPELLSIQSILKPSSFCTLIKVSQPEIVLSHPHFNTYSKISVDVISEVENPTALPSSQLAQLVEVALEMLQCYILQYYVTVLHVIVTSIYKFTSIQFTSIVGLNMLLFKLIQIHPQLKEYMAKWIMHWTLRPKGLGFNSQRRSCVEVLDKLCIPHCLSPPIHNGYLAHR